MRDYEWVLLSFVIFMGILWYVGAFRKIGDMLDGRASDIQSQLDEARAARAEAQALLASFEAKRASAEAEAQGIVARAEEEARKALADAEVEIERSMARRLKSAEERIAQAEAAAKRKVHDAAADAAVAAASRLLGARLEGDAGEAALDASLKEVAQRLH
ncbi:ATP F0F1 synthase subunit B [Neomegalonema sp.]|uniref:F0F1 ATP synthase subunit B family protein n=1 Tax=Neomegalonema sp. TaxID=2039713 RepID=UPI0026259A20|nr:ATP F0F1 synthase subunit B [Neomegalonema sp.]MDD2869083.1 ATP F0F1 synthase subunit B [Neomegalonema sp.]